MFSEWHMVIFLVVVLLIFGPSKLPKLAQAIGKSVRELKNGMAGLSEDIKDNVPAPHVEQRREDPKPAAEAPKTPAAPAGTVESTESQVTKNG